MEALYGCQCMVSECTHCCVPISKKSHSLGVEQNGRQSNPKAFIDDTLQVGDFGDAINWPTPGEIAHKSVQVSVGRGWQVQVVFILT